MYKLLIILLLIPFVSASDPDFKISSSINTTLEINDNTHGDVVITKQQYISDFYNIHNFNSYTFQKHDKITWKGNTSIEIYKTNNTRALLLKDSSYYFLDTGIYTYESIINTSNSGTFTITPEDNCIINAKYTLKKNNNIVIEKDLGEYTIEDEKVIPINFKIENTLNPGEYDFEFTTTSSFKNDSLTKKMTVTKDRSWTMEDNTKKNLSLKAGEVINAGNVYLTNNGNIDYNIQSAIYGNGSDFIYTPINMTLIRGVKTPFPIVIQIPLQQADGIYKAIINIKNDDVIKDINIKMNITDNVKPSITNVSFSEDTLYKENKITVKTKDNVEVKKCNLSFAYSKTENNKTLNISESFELEKDNQFFYLTHTFTHPEMYWFYICIEDNAKNQDCRWYNKTFNKIQHITNISNIKMPSIKKGMRSIKYAFTLEEEPPEPINITLTDFSTDIINDTFNYEVRLTDNYGAIYVFKSLNSSIKLSIPSNYILEIKGEKVTAYEGLFKFSQYPYMKVIGDIVFSGEFKDYDPPKDFTLTGYGKEIICKATDTGDLDTSYVTCPIEYPANTDFTQLLIPVTANEMELERENTALKIQEYKDKVKNRDYLISGILGIFVITLFFLLYYQLIYPNFRWRVR